MLRIRGLRKIWADQNNAVKGDPVDEEGVKRLAGWNPICPEGGRYKFNAVGHLPQCSIHGVCPEPNLPKRENSGTNLSTSL